VSGKFTYTTKIEQEEAIFQLFRWSIGELGLEQCIGTVEVV